MKDTYVDLLDEEPQTGNTHYEVGQSKKNRVSRDDLSSCL